MIGDQTKQVESDITITDRAGRLLAVFDGFAVQSLSASSRMSPERIDKGLYEIQWCDDSDETNTARTRARERDSRFVLARLRRRLRRRRSLAEELRRRGHRVRTVEHRSVDELTEIDGGYVMNTGCPEQMGELLTHLGGEGDLAGIVDCWPLDIAADDVDENHRLGAFTILRLVKALAEHDTVKPRLYLSPPTRNRHPEPNCAPSTRPPSGGSAESSVTRNSPNTGAASSTSTDADDRAETAARICEHLLDDGVRRSDRDPRPTRHSSRACVHAAA